MTLCSIGSHNLFLGTIMKKLVVSLGFVLLIVGGGFVWLLSQSGPGNAPQDEVTVDLTDQIAK